MVLSSIGEMLVLRLIASFTTCRIVPGFLVQTGDRSGTGGGGESFFGGTYSLHCLGSTYHVLSVQNLLRTKFILDYASPTVV